MGAWDQWARGQSPGRECGEDDPEKRQQNVEFTTQFYFRII